MPIYEYRCKKCGHELEAIQKISDSLLTECPQCNADALVKKISAAGFRLKGGGWYETDFKSGSKKNVSGSESGSTSSSDASKSDSSSSSDSSSESSSGGASSSNAKSDAKKEPKKKDGGSGSSSSKSSASD